MIIWHFIDSGSRTPRQNGSPAMIMIEFYIKTLRFAWQTLGSLSLGMTPLAPPVVCLANQAGVQAMIITCRNASDLLFPGILVKGFKRRGDQSFPLSRLTYLPFLFFLFCPDEGLVPPLLRGASLAPTSACTGDELSPARTLEEPRLLLSFVPDFLGLRLLTPLRPIFTPCL